MKIFKYIGFFFCLTLVFSCTKPDDESPSGVVPSSVTDEPFREFEQHILPEENNGTAPEPSFINDDGDDESGPDGVRNPK